ncbi:MAG: PleD family two-component system response regulator [Nitrospinales bacterium]
MSKVTAAEILKEVPITRKTLWLWQKKYHFFPDPEKKVHPGGRGIVGYYPAWVRARCKQVYDLQKKGYSVPMIKEILQKEAREKSTKKILIVDDERKFADLLRKMFIKKGFVVEVAYDGLDAGLKASEFRPAIILLDLGLPGLNGLEVCKLLKSNPKTKHINIIAISGDLSYPEETVLDSGALMFFKKPVNMTRLLKECSVLVNSPEFDDSIPSNSP